MFNLRTHFWNRAFLMLSPTVVNPQPTPTRVALFWKKKSACGNAPRSSGLVKNMGAIFLKKKSACGNVPRSSGLPKIWGPFFWKKKRLRQRAQKLEAQGFQKDGGPFFKNILSRNRLNRLLIYPIMVTKKSIWSKSHSGYCFRLPLA